MTKKHLFIGLVMLLILCHSTIALGADPNPRADGKYYLSDYNGAGETSKAVTHLNGIGSDVTLVIDEADSVTANTTANEEITWEFLPGNVITVTSGDTLTINGPVDAPLVQIFANSGTISLGDGEKILAAYPNWWGAVADWNGTSGTDNLSAFDDCFDSGARVIRIPDGEFYIGSLGGITGDSDIGRIEGAGRGKTKIVYGGSGTALTMSGGSVAIKQLTIETTATAGIGISFDTAARKVMLQDSIIISAGSSSNTGTGLELDASSGGWLGGVNLTNVEVRGFKYGIKCIGSDGANTVTCITGSDVWLIGRPSGVVSGSCGVYTDANTNAVGSIFNGGSIQYFATGLSITNGASAGMGHGVSFIGDFTGNTTDWSLGDGFDGVAWDTETGKFQKQGNNASSNIWWRDKYTPGNSLETYSYYNHYFDFRCNGALLKFGARDDAASSNDLAGFAFAGSGDYRPQMNYIYQQGRKLTWHTEWPNVGTWAVGDRCFSSTPSSGNPKGWVCTVAGSPGTWISTGNL